MPTTPDLSDFGRHGREVRLEVEARLRAAKAFAEFALDGKTDKVDAPLVDHAVRMADSFPGLPVNFESERVVAYLHDVLEDSEAKLVDEGLADTIRLHGLSFTLTRAEAFALEAITRREGETYAEFIVRLRDEGNTISLLVKRADLYDHLADPDAIPYSLKKRYWAALQVLEETQADSLGEVMGYEGQPESFLD